MSLTIAFDNGLASSILRKKVFQYIYHSISLVLSIANLWITPVHMQPLFSLSHCLLNCLSEQPCIYSTPIKLTFIKVINYSMLAKPAFTSLICFNIFIKSKCFFHKIISAFGDYNSIISFFLTFYFLHFLILILGHFLFDLTS